MLFSPPSGWSIVENYYRSWQDDREAAQRSAQIDRQIEQDSKRLKKECKVLLLGLSGSGKSTLVKQMHIIYQDGFSHDAKMQYRESIYSNLLESAQAVAAALQEFNVEPTNPSNVQMLERILKYDLDAELLSPTRPYPFVFPSHLAEAIHRLWQDQAVQEFVENYGSQFYLMKNAVYFFTEVLRIAPSDYVPTETDILRCKRRSTGIVETVFSVSQVSIRLLEVSSQHERRKWIHYFEGITSIIFCTALSDYDQVLMEARNQNRIAESLVLFDSVINSRWFLRTSIILLLNKVDIFRDKLRTVPLERYFQEYTGGPNVNKAAKYILWRFMQANRAKLNVYPHITQSTDVSNIRLIFAAVANTVINNALKDRDIL